ncbi:MAG: DUF4332 domain-containing protein [Caldilineaceae bacterium]
MSFQVFWFLLAGFILGFTTSTLWEWLYYRRKRERMVANGQRLTAFTRQEDARTNPATDDDDAENHWLSTKTETAPPLYRSPGIFLESEQAAPEVEALIAPVVKAPHRTVSAPEAPAAGSRPAPVKPLSPAVASPSVGVSADTAAAATAVTSPRVPAPPNRSGAPAESSTALGPTDPVTATPIAAAMTTPQESAVQLNDPATPETGAKEAETPPAPRPAVRQPLNHPDDLALIKGIGDAYKRRLYSAGIYTWRQVAESEIETLRRITRAKPNADIQAWQTHARELAQSRQRWDALFTGPLDDFTRVEGIGGITADILYRAGIFTYEQLAAATPDELTRIVPAPTVGAEIDFNAWVNAATHLANNKRRNQGLLP